MKKFDIIRRKFLKSAMLAGVGAYQLQKFFPWKMALEKCQLMMD